MSLTTVDPGLLSGQSQYTGFKNRIINGAMQIDQRNAGAQNNLSTGNPTPFVADRFKTFFFGSTYSGTMALSQVVSDAPIGFQNSVKYTANQSLSFDSNKLGVFMTQAIEANNCFDFYTSGGGISSMSVSFWVKASKTGTISVSVEALGGSSTASYLTFVSITATNTWEYKTVNIPENSFGGSGLLLGNSAGLLLNIGLASNGSWLASSNTGWKDSANRAVFISTQTNFLSSTNDTIQITGVQLEKGTTSTSFDYRPYGTELALCQRYFERGNPKVFVTGTYALGSYTNTGTGIYSFKQVKRASPTMTMNSFNNIDNASNAGIYATGGQDSGDSFCFTLTINSYTNYPYAVAYINFSASSEL